jgi:S-formylglutathione hydrolase FrmB
VPGPTPQAQRRSARSGRRLIAALALALAALLAVAGWEARSGATDLHGARVVGFTIHSRLAHRDLPATAVIPPGAAPGERPLLVFLHGKGPRGEDSNLSAELFAGLARLGSRAPAIVFPNGGEESFWHDRAGGAWGAYVVREVIPEAIRRLGADPRRVAIGGISMGGFGALDLARRYRGQFCAVGGHSAALWTRGADTAPGAFDDARDFARHDVIAAASTTTAYRAVPLWLDVGSADPFRAADTRLATVLRRRGAQVEFHVWPGGHDGAYWRAHVGRYLGFYAAALARCR